MQRAQYRLLSHFKNKAHGSAIAYHLLDLDSSDVDAMSALQTRCNSPHVVAKTPDEYYAHFDQGHGAIGFFDNKHRLVAHSLIINNASSSRILNVLVDPQHEGRSLHTQMMKEYFILAREAACTHALANVRTSNHRSLRNFARAGFSIVATGPSPDAPGEIVHFMQKQLMKTTDLHTLYAQAPSIGN